MSETFADASAQQAPSDDRPPTPDHRPAAASDDDDEHIALQGDELESYKDSIIIVHDTAKWFVGGVVTSAVAVLASIKLADVRQLDADTAPGRIVTLAILLSVLLSAIAVIVMLRTASKALHLPYADPARFQADYVRWRIWSATRRRWWIGARWHRGLRRAIAYIDRHVDDFTRSGSYESMGDLYVCDINTANNRASMRADLYRLTARANLSIVRYWHRRLVNTVILTGFAVMVSMCAYASTIMLRSTDQLEAPQDVWVEFREDAARPPGCDKDLDSLEAVYIGGELATADVVFRGEGGCRDPGQMTVDPAEAVVVPRLP